MVDTVMNGIVIGLLVITTIQDLILKKISIWIVAVAGVALWICSLLSGSMGMGDRIGGFMVGIGMLLLSLISKGKVGMGDGIILCVTGLALGFWMNMELLAVALFVAAILSIFLLIFRLVTRKESIPFVPFLLVSYLFLIAI